MTHKGLCVIKPQHYQKTSSKYLNRPASANSVDSDQILQNVASDQTLFCLQLILQYLDPSAGCKIDLFKFYEM